MNHTSRPLFSTAVLFVSSFLLCIASVAVTWLLRGRQLSGTLPLSVVAFTLMLVIPAGQFIRNRCKLSLRSMLVLMTALAVLLGLFGTNMNRARLQRRAVRSIQALNLTSKDFFSQPQPSVGYDRADDLGGDFVRTSGGWIVPSWLVDFLGEDFFFEVQFVDIANMDLSQEGALANVELGQFKRIHFRNCKLGPSAMESISSLPQAPLFGVHQREDNRHPPERNRETRQPGNAQYSKSSSIRVCKRYHARRAIRVIKNNWLAKSFFGEPWPVQR